MTEHEWLASTNPAAMLDYLRERGLATDKLLHFAHEAVRGHGIAEHLFFRPGENDVAKTGCAILRDIFGNPFRPIGDGLKCRRCNGELVQGPKRDLLPLFSHCGKCGEEGPFWATVELSRRVIPDAWLAWNDGTVAKLAQAIAGGEKCKCVTKWKHRHTEPGQTCDCQSCHGTGKTPPDWSLMGQLADALEEAGCTNEEILMHCRGKEIGPVDAIPCLCKRCGRTENRKSWSVQSRCMKCKGGMVRVDGNKMPFGSHGLPRTGLIPLRGPHVRGCWVLELILGQLEAKSESKPNENKGPDRCSAAAIVDTSNYES